MKILFKALFLLLFLSSCYTPDQSFAPSHPYYKLANPSLGTELEQKIRNQMTGHLLKVAVIDGGIDYLHPRLAKNLRFNTFGQGIGLDITGRDSYPYYTVIDPETGSDMSEVFEVKEHGTHVSSLALLGGYVSRPDNSKVNAGDVLGLIPIRAISFSEEDLISEEDLRGENVAGDFLSALLNEEREMVRLLIKNMTKALNFAHKEGAFIVNMSLGAMVESLSDDGRVVYDELIKSEFLPKVSTVWSDMLIIIAAGNESLDLGKFHTFPASLGLKNGIVVGALDESGQRAEYSNFGQAVEVLVRGTEVKAMVPGGSSAKFSGTSMAAPLIANLAAKIKLTAPCLDVSAVKSLILTTSDNNRVVSFSKALKAAENYCR